jgi:hypothetical protein
MQMLVNDIMYRSDAGVEAVTSLLLLSQWVLRRPTPGISEGNTPEDRVSWMYIGDALRLGWYLGIDRTAFRISGAPEDKSFRRKRLVWAASYICDRLVSTPAFPNLNLKVFSEMSSFNNRARGFQT